MEICSKSRERERERERQLRATNLFSVKGDTGNMENYNKGRKRDRERQKEMEETDVFSCQTPDNEDMMLAFQLLTKLTFPPRNEEPSK